jgi:hypothetical protein
MLTRVSAPVLVGERTGFLELILVKQARLEPVSSGFVDLISDSDTISALFLAWEAAFKRWGAPVETMSVGLSDASRKWLTSRRWMVQGDSLGLAAYLLFAARFQDYFASYRRIVATGAIERKKDGFRIRGVAGVKDKIIGTRQRYGGAQAIVVPFENALSIDVGCCVQDIWIAGPDLNFFRPYAAVNKLS